MYRKFSADDLFSGQQFLGNENVLITATDGTVIDIINKADAGDGVEVFNGILTPGFVNCHCHIELSHLKNAIPPKTGLVDFLQQVMTIRNNYPDEKKQQAITAAEQELYNSGTIAVGDICNTTDSLSVKQKSKLYWHNFVEVSGFIDAVAEKRLEAAKNILEKFNTQRSLSPHAPYSVSKTLFELLNDETNKQLITIHNQESPEEDKLYKNKEGLFLMLYKNFGIDISDFDPTGKSSLQSWFPYFNKEQSIILVHNTFTTQSDIEHIKIQNSKFKIQNFFCVCANANRYIEQTIPPLDLWRKNNCTIVIGTDSYASNWQLNILEEIKTIRQETSFKIPLEEILQWATINGAKALQIDNYSGSFEKGKKPGVVLIDEVQNGEIHKSSTAKRII